MIHWIELTRYGADRKVPVNVAMIAWVDQTPGGAMIYFGAGGSLRVCETVEAIKSMTGVKKAART